MKLGKGEKIAVAVGALVVAYLVYRYFGSSSGSTTAPADSAAADYAAESGQEQSDVANLQGGLDALSGQEQSDVANAMAQEQGDFANLLKAIGALQNAGKAGAGTAGHITTHPGGAFYRFYKGLTGKEPPKTLSVTNPIYQAWKSAGQKERNRIAGGHKPPAGKSHGAKAKQTARTHQTQRAQTQRRKNARGSAHTHASPNTHIAPSNHAPKTPHRGKARK